MAFAFACSNGFHDAANAIATLVATRAARPAQAVVLASVLTLLGPLLLGAAVAETVAGAISVPRASLVPVVGAALTGAVGWNLLTWALGLPSSSSHALIGGLAGAALAQAGPDAVRWTGDHGLGFGAVLVGLAVSPLLGAASAAALELGLRRRLVRASARIGPVVLRAQWATSAILALAHGANDAQKAVGLVAVLLFASGVHESVRAPTWVVAAVALALATGTALGGWRIARTIGRRILRLRPVDALASQSGSAAVIALASLLGVPVSTSQVVASSVVGAGIGKRRTRRIRWHVVRQIGLAWVTTVPAAGLVAAASLPVWRWLA
jgi:PiT family inorganic phosphate transporter